MRSALRVDSQASIGFAVLSSPWWNYRFQTTAGRNASGKARVSYVTDGSSVRATLTDGMFGMQPGTIRLAQRQNNNLYVIDPQRRTYFIARTDPWAKGTEAPTVAIERSEVSKRLLGYKATKVTLTYSQRVRLRGAQDGQGLHDSFRLSGCHQGRHSQQVTRAWRALLPASPVHNRALASHDGQLV